MALIQRWEGRAYGTSRGKVFVELKGEGVNLTGTLHLNEETAGLVVYFMQGTFDGSNFNLVGEPSFLPEGADSWKLFVKTELNTQGRLQGKWETSIGEAGVFFLFPCNQISEGEDSIDQTPPPLHTQQYDFGAVAIDRSEIIDIADGIQRDFKDKEIIVTINKSGTQQSQYLGQFKQEKFSPEEKGTFISLSAQEPDVGGLNRVIRVEFGPQVNFVMTQSGDEAWVLGMLEKLKHKIRPLERNYITNFKKYFLTSHWLVVLAAIVIFPSIETIWNRAFVMVVIVMGIYGMIWFHQRHLPLTTIYFGQKPKDMFSRIMPSMLSWFMGIVAGIVIILLATVIQGGLELPFSW